MAGVDVRFSISSALEIKKKRGLETGGAVQKYVDETVIRFCEPYVPVDTGALRDSPKSSSPPGGGKVVYGKDYARKQYYENKGGEGLRGKMWFERMKADRGDEIITGAAERAGGRKMGKGKSNGI